MRYAILANAPRTDKRQTERRPSAIGFCLPPHTAGVTRFLYCAGQRRCAMDRQLVNAVGAVLLTVMAGCATLPRETA